MTLQRFAPAVLAIACLQVCTTAHAQDAGSVRFSGFGTVAGNITDNDDVYFVTPGQTRGANSHGFSLNPDSKLGGQVDYKLNSMFSATAQVLSHYTDKDNWNPSLEWAFAKAAITPELSTRVGRIGSPYFAISDFRQVNYANIWVRPPLEVYAQVPFSHFDGADITYQKDLNGTILTGTAYYGHSKAPYLGNELKLNGARGLNLTGEFESGLTVRYGYSTGRLVYGGPDIQAVINGVTQIAGAFAAGGPLNPLSNATLSQVSANSAAYANDLKIGGVFASFQGLGATWDKGNIVLSGEYTKRKVAQYVNSTDGWYMSAGYRIGKFTPYLVYGELKQKTDSPTNPVDLAAIQSGVAATAGAIAGGGGNPTAYLSGAAAGRTAAIAASHGVDHTNASNDLGQKTISLGARWDARSNLAIKTQLDFSKPDSTNGLFYTPKASGQDVGAVPDMKGKTIKVFTISADFVF